MTISSDVARGLDGVAAALIRRIIPNLNLLADLLHADVLLFARAGTLIEVLDHAQPSPVPSVYQDSLTGRRLRPEQVRPIAQILFQGRARHEVQGAVVNGVPILREVLAVRDSEGRVIAALATETAVIEHERVQKRTSVLRRALSRVRDLVAQGRLTGGESIGRLGLHDGMLIIDADGMIQYASSVAEGLYRLLGIVDQLTNTQLSELDTNEYLAFRAMETGVCMEQRVTEQDRIWIKKAIPLVAGDSPGWVSRLPGHARAPPGRRDHHHPGRHPGRAQGAGDQGQERHDPGDSPPGEEQPPDDHGAVAAPVPPRRIRRSGHGPERGGRADHERGRRPRVSLEGRVQHHQHPRSLQADHAGVRHTARSIR